jgi:prophage antirepressor-like protein
LGAPEPAPVSPAIPGPAPAVVEVPAEPVAAIVRTDAITPFAFEGREVRVQVDERGEPWFCAADVCEVLGLEKVSNAVERLEPDEKGTRLTGTPGGPQQLLHLNEPGLYRLLMRSDKPQAKPFQRWVTHEVLPSIRKTGSYSAAPAVTALGTREQRIAAALLETAEVIAERDAKIAEQARGERQHRGEGRSASTRGRIAQGALPLPPGDPTNRRNSSVGLDVK